MAQNLNYGTRINGIANQTNNNIPEKYCYNDLESNCDVYGGLYQWAEAMQYSATEGVQGICPIGWHLPTDAEWTTLTTYLGGESVAGGKMKSTGTIQLFNGVWLSPNTGATNSSGFNAHPGGQRSLDGSFVVLSINGTIWSSSGDINGAWYRNLYSYSERVGRGYEAKANGFAVRCVQD